MNRLPALGMLLAFAIWPQVQAASPPSAADRQLVDQILHSETQPNVVSVDRRHLLAPSANTTDAVKWQSGFVKVADRWHDADTLLDESNSALMDEYRALRQATPNSVEGHMKLANWCQAHKLPDQERAHLAQVLMQAPETFDRVPIYRRMGFRTAGRHWASPAELQDLQAKQRHREEDLREWGPKVERIVRNWNVPGKQQKQAQEQLKAVIHPAAIPALVAAAMNDESLALAICEKLGKMESFESSQGLALIAVQSPWSAVRQLAAKKLKGRRIDDFAPALLGQMCSAFSVAKTTSSGIRPTLYFREEANRYYAIDLRLLPAVVIANETRVQPIAGTINTVSKLSLTNVRNVDGERRLADADLELTHRLEQVNDRAEEYNERAATVLAEVTGQEPSRDAKYWWAWWHLYAGTLPMPKQCQVDLALVPAPARTVERIVVGHSCLVAGTPICTDRGLIAVDQIQVGDRVLSKNITTGEVDYKPVEHTTVRSPVPVKRFVVAGEPIIASAGHHFWISGHGWTKTRELKTGLPVHTATGMSRIESAADEPDLAPVYNLIVADFHTYFVGPSMVLSHDVTHPAPTNIKVPGLEAK
ncbi:MAG: hypothetical protein JSS49_12445 [Planctomycetes bacterium]|nr:hypothetical protein [Planctomycetota bacterium]